MMMVYQFHPSNREINIKFMFHIIHGILDHHPVDGTHCQWLNSPIISTVANNIQHELDGPYSMFWLTQQTAVDGMYQIFWLNQVENDPNHLHGHHNKQLYHHDPATGILDAMIYHKRHVPLILVTWLTPTKHSKEDFTGIKITICNTKNKWSYGVIISELDIGMFCFIVLWPFKNLYLLTLFSFLILLLISLFKSHRDYIKF